MLLENLDILYYLHNFLEIEDYLKLGLNKSMRTKVINTLPLYYKKQDKLFLSSMYVFCKKKYIGVINMKILNIITDSICFKINESYGHERYLYMIKLYHIIINNCETWNKLYIDKVYILDKLFEVYNNYYTLDYKENMYRVMNIFKKFIKNTLTDKKTCDIYLGYFDNFKYSKLNICMRRKSVNLIKKLRSIILTIKSTYN